MITLHKLSLTLNTISNRFPPPLNALPQAGGQAGGAAKPEEAALRITTFGGMQVLDAKERDLTPRIRRSRAVLAILAMAAPRPVMRDDLAALLWSRRDRDLARASLRQCVHELQFLLAPIKPDILDATRNFLLLRLDHVWIDVRAGVVSADPFLNDLAGLDPAFDTWIATERRRISRRATALAEATLLQQSGPSGEPRLAIAAAEDLLMVDPANERGWRELISGLIAIGNRTGAHEAYRRCVATLSEITEAGPPADIHALIAGQPRQVERVRVNTPAPSQDRRPGLRLGVRPFRALGGGDTEPLSLGLAEEITAALSRFKWMFLIASPSLAALGSDPSPDDARWRELGLDFVLDGTVQRAADRVRVMVRLLDVRGIPEVVWAGRFDRAGNDVLNLQDDITAEAAARIDPELMLREGQRAVTQVPNDATAYDLTLSAIPAIYRLEETSFRAAGAALAEAVRIDPDYAAAHAWWACWHIFLVGQNWAPSPAVAMSRAAALAERAIALDPGDARGLTIAGHVRAFLYRRVGEALELHERALSLNPNLPLAWVLSGLAEAYAGRHSEALSRVHHAKQLSPYDPHTFFFDQALMLPHLLRKEFAITVELGHRAIALNPALTSTYKIALSALGHLGRTEEAARLGAKLLDIEPEFSVGNSFRRTPLLVPEDLELYVAGLRLAGLPE